ncbi:MAG: hypothetical protein U5K76_05960 [Woeseiaceae bacterium]|nr:hypothetical protein [Woeseiaceae bacterium]
MDGNTLAKTLLTTALLIVLGACGRDAPEQPSLAADNALLEYVSADTPYLFAMLEPLPEDVLDRLEPGANRVMLSYQDAIRAATRDIAAEQSGEEAERRETATAALDGIVDLFSIDAMRAAGIGRESTMALYAHGLLPVLRVALTDTDAFEQAIADIEADAGQAMPTGTIDDVSYRFVGDEAVRLVVAIIGNHAVISIVPSSLGEDALRGVLGLTLPGESIEDAGTLAALSGSYGFSAYGAGFIDIERLARTFLEPQSGTNAEVLALLDYDSTRVSDVCRSENARHGADRAPRGNRLHQRHGRTHWLQHGVRTARGPGHRPGPASVPGSGTGHGPRRAVVDWCELRPAGGSRILRKPAGRDGG